MKRLSVVTLVFVLSTLIGAAPSSAIPAGMAPSPEDPAAPPQNEPLAFTPCVDGMAGIYPCQGIDLLAFVPLGSMGCGSGNDIWGWNDPVTGSEYALMGCNNGTSFVDVTDPQNPVYVGRLPTHTSNSSWRDIKVYQDHAFVVSEAGSHGMQVFDLTELRGVTNPPVTFTETAHYGGFGSAHNVAINEQTGFAYAIGGGACSGGPKFVDIQDPLNPTDAGCYSADGYTHDAQCVVYQGPDSEHAGKEICFNSNEDTLTIVDVTDKENPVQIARQGYVGSAYTHQGWLTEDHAYFLLDDELDENGSNLTRTYIWNLDDLDNPDQFAVHQGLTTAIDHNQYVKGQFSFQSNYTAGLRILDIGDVAAGDLEEIAYFDIFPANNSASFSGTWSNYPYLPSGIIVVSGMGEGLFVLQTNAVSINDATVFEGVGDLTFTVTLAAASSQTVTVDYATADNTAQGGASCAELGADFVATSGVLTFDPGVTSRPLPVTICNDGEEELSETFFMELSNPVNVSIGDAQGVGSIKDRNTSITISNTTVQEGDSGTTTVKVWVGVAWNGSTGTVTVDYATADATAIAGEDYVATSGNMSITWPTLQKSLDVEVIGDLIDEGVEAFLVNLSNPTGAVIDDGQATVTIDNDDVVALTCTSPTSAPGAGGAVLTFFGEGFIDGTEVDFGATPATNVTVVSETEMDVTTPALPSGTLQEIHVNHPAADPAPLHPEHARLFVDFDDVPAAHAFHDFAESLFRNGVTSGCGAGVFCPDTAVTREQMAVFVLVAKEGSGFNPPACTTSPFGDIPAASPFCPWIKELADRGIVAGCGGGNYCPNDPVSRQQMSVFLLATLEGSGYTPPACTVAPFDDVPVESGFCPWIQELADRGITAGCGGGNYCPNDPNTRGQMAVFLSATFELPPPDIACP